MVDLCVCVFVVQEAQVVVECVIPHKHHRDVMGAKGANVQAVSQENNVTIKFPDRGKRKIPFPLLFLLFLFRVAIIIGKFVLMDLLA